jgi:hypothetical protein
MFCTVARAQAFVDNAMFTKYKRMELFGVTYHSKAYKAAKKSDSRGVCFYHAIPGSGNVVKQYGRVEFYLCCDSLQPPRQLVRHVLAYVRCHPIVPSPDDLQDSTLVLKGGSNPCFIPAQSIISRVIFIHNPKFPKDQNRPTMYVSPELDHRF